MLLLVAVSASVVITHANCKFTRAKSCRSDTTPASRNGKSDLLASTGILLLSSRGMWMVQKALADSTGVGNAPPPRSPPPPPLPLISGPSPSPASTLAAASLVGTPGDDGVCSSRESSVDSSSRDSTFWSGSSPSPFPAVGLGCCFWLSFPASPVPLATAAATALSSTTFGVSTGATVSSIIAATVSSVASVVDISHDARMSQQHNAKPRSNGTQTSWIRLQQWVFFSTSLTYSSLVASVRFSPS